MPKRSYPEGAAVGLTSVIPFGGIDCIAQQLWHGYNEAEERGEVDVADDETGHMKVMINRGRRSQAVRLAILSVTIALVMVMAQCAPVIRYDLNVSSTKGGSVINPGEGTFTYNAGRVVRLVARSALGYTFAGWTGDVATIANVRSFSTTIVVNGNYNIIANFGCGC